MGIMDAQKNIFHIVLFILLVAAALILIASKQSIITGGVREIREPRGNSGAVFTDIYENDIWGDNNNPNYKGSSGVGSAYFYNKYTYIPFMHQFLKEYEIKSVVDLGCGDFRIGPALYDDLDITYTGYDAYDKLIQNHKARINNPQKYTFITADFTKKSELERLKPADLCILKDVLQHWPFRTITKVMDYLVSCKKYKYILVVNCYKKDDIFDRTYKKDIKMGEWHPLSTYSYPLNRYKGIKLFNWDTKEVSLITT